MSKSKGVTQQSRRLGYFEDNGKTQGKGAKGGNDGDSDDDSFDRDETQLN